jgi:hypothetical protein
LVTKRGQENRLAVIKDVAQSFLQDQVNWRHLKIPIQPLLFPMKDYLTEGDLNSKFKARENFYGITLETLSDILYWIHLETI